MGARLILEYAGNSAGTEADEMGFNLKKGNTGETSFAQCTFDDSLGAKNLEILLEQISQLSEVTEITGTSSN